MNIFNFTFKPVMPDIITECKRALEDAGLQPELCDGKEFHHIAPYPYLMLKYPVLDLFGYVFIFTHKNNFIVSRFDCIKSFNGEPDTFHRGISVYDNIRDVTRVVQRIYDRFSTIDGNIPKRIGYEILEFYSKYTNIIPNYIAWDNPVENDLPMKFGIAAAVCIFIVQFEQVKVIMPMCDMNNNVHCYRCGVMENKFWAEKIPANLADKILDFTPREVYKFPNGEIPDLGEDDKYNFYMMDGPHDHADESSDSDADETKVTMSNEDINTLINALNDLKMSNREVQTNTEEQKQTEEQNQSEEQKQSEEHTFDEDARQEDQANQASQSGQEEQPNQVSQPNQTDQEQKTDSSEESNENQSDTSIDSTPITTHGKTYELESHFLEKLANGLDLAIQMHKNKYANSMILIGTSSTEEQ